MLGGVGWTRVQISTGETQIIAGDFRRVNRRSQVMEHWREGVVESADRWPGWEGAEDKGEDEVEKEDDSHGVIPWKS